MKAASLNKSLCLSASSARNSTGAFFGLPLPMGEYLDAKRIRLFNQDSQRAVSEFSAKTTWPDGSIKWLSGFGVLHKDNQYYLAQSDTHTEQILPTVAHAFKLNNNSISLLEYGLEVRLSCEIKDSHCTLTLHEHLIDSTSPLYSKANLVYLVDQIPGLRISLSLTSVQASQEISASVRIENTLAAVHANGTWDLGDPNSLLIEKLSLQLNSIDKLSSTLNLVDEANKQPHQFKQGTIRLTQHSSGGENWQSPTHVDASNQVPVTQNGFQVVANNEVIATGNRAQPWLEINTQKKTGLYCCVADFWQNFPAAIETADQKIYFDLFPQLTELQAGESKKWQIQLGQLANYDTGTTPSFEAIPYSLEAGFLNNSGVFPVCELNNSNSFTDIINAGINGSRSFIAKREACDEYGWRNFGELYADHEALGKPSDPIFVSHYNNQYDTLMGTTIQSLNNPSGQWQKISIPLARHIADIDIYNTESDKPEYNGGLFWHTDHYLPASTCTHRTYSKNHTSVYDGHQGGGGPGGQHCYSTGLLMHALLFQDSIAEAKVKQLTRWIRNFYNGSHSLLGRLHRFLTIDLKSNQLTNIGIVFPGYRYPLDRGTGNYINTLIDCYEIENNSDLLKEAAFVIRNTVGLADDIAERNLDDIENAWFYTVFLQAVIKFLRTKESLQENDADYAYARKIISKFGHWMLEHEAPYLDTPEKLEFPTDTWAAQDIRKAIIFRYLAYFEYDLSEAYQAKAEYFYQYVKRKLEHSEEASTTRCLAILMQNYGLYEKTIELGSCSIVPIKLSKKELRSNGQPSLVRLSNDLLKILKHFSISEEAHWVNTRLGKNGRHREIVND